LEKWIKMKSRMLSKYKVFQLPKKHGGLNAPNLPDMIDAQLMLIWIKLITENNLWARAERTLIEKMAPEALASYSHESGTPLHLSIYHGKEKYADTKFLFPEVVFAVTGLTRTGRKAF